MARDREFPPPDDPEDDRAVPRREPTDGKPRQIRLIIEGVNLIKRHTKPNPGKNVKGGIVEREASLHASNVQLVCPECGVQTRIGHKTLGDGRKVRICRKCDGVVDK